MKFTKRTDYALRTMEALAKLPKGQSVSVKALCTKNGMAIKFLQAVVTDLARAGLVGAKAGPGGGVILAKNASLITILEIIEAVEGKLNIMACLEHPHSCSDHCKCSIMRILFEAQETFKQRLKESTLALMIGAKVDVFDRVPEGHFQKPTQPCPVLQNTSEKSKKVL